MNTVLAVGTTLTVAGLVGYLVGLATAYPGRAFSVTGVMVGITLLAIGWGERPTSGGDGMTVDSGGDGMTVDSGGDGMTVDSGGDGMTVDSGGDST